MPPRAEYETRRADRQGVAAALSVRHTYIAHARLATFLTIVPVGWLVFGPQLLSPWWLLAPVAALRAQLDWRETLAGLGSDVRDTVQPQGLAAWAAAPRRLAAHWERILIDVFVLLTLAALTLWLTDVTTISPFFLTILAQGAF